MSVDRLTTSGPDGRIDSLEVGLIAHAALMALAGDDQGKRDYYTRAIKHEMRQRPLAVRQVPGSTCLFGLVGRARTCALFVVRADGAHAAPHAAPADYRPKTLPNMM